MAGMARVVAAVAMLIFVNARQAMHRTAEFGVGPGQVPFGPVGPPSGVEEAPPAIVQLEQEFPLACRGHDPRLRRVEEPAAGRVSIQ